MLSLALVIILATAPPVPAPPDSLGAASPPALQGLSAGAFT